MARPHRVPGTRTQRPVRALALVVLPTETCPEPLALQLRLRAEATSTGRCACGAHWNLLAAAASRVVEPTMLHEADCPVATLTAAQVQRAMARGHAQNGCVIVEFREAA